MIPITCLNCKNYIDSLKCSAFSDIIPDEVLNGENDHTKPLPDQENDIVFEPINDGKTE